MSAFVKKGVLLDFSPTCSVHNEINPGKGAAVTNFSSGDANKENKSGSYPVLSLVQFSRAPFVSFETVKLGSSKGSVLVVENPNQDVAEVKIDKFPSAKGFSVDHRHFILKVILSITWTPVEEGGVRELITFIANGIVKHQAILLGRAEAPKKKRKSLWDSIKTKRPSECPVPAKGRKTDSSLKKSANKTFHVSRKVQYVKEKGRSPLSSYSNAPIVGSTLMSNPAESRSGLSEKESYYTPGSLQKSKTCSALDKSKSNDSFLDDKSVPLPRPTFLVSDFDHVERSDHIETRTFECSSLVPSTSDVRVVSVLNRTHSPVYTPDRVVNPLTPRINSRRAPDSFLREDAPDGGLKFSPVTPILSVQDALAIIQSDVTHGCEEGDVLPAMCSSFDFSDSLDLLTDTEGFLSSKPAEPLALPEISSDFEPVKARLTFFVKSKTVHEHESKDETKHARVTTKSKKHTFLAETVTKSRSCSSQESKPEHGRKASSKRLLMDKTVELIEDECVKPVSRVFKAVKFQSLPVIDSDVSLEAPNASGQSQSPLVVVQSNFSAVVSHQHLSPVLAPLSLTSNVAEEPGLSPIVPTRTSTVRSSVKTSLKTTKSVAGVAQSQLTFIKPVQTAIPRHPLPFAAKNMFYDERWIEKQERGFTWWINYVLTPDDFKVNTEVSKVSAMSLVMGVENQHKVSVPKAPTKEEMSFKAYTARCRLNRLRRAACCLFTSESMVKAIQRLELEIEAKRLLVRKDRHLWKDIGERQKVLNWLLSYNPLWLRIGLEVIYGELISLESNSDVMGMAMFILNRLLWNPDIAAEYRHPKVPHLYRDGHEEALSRFTLKKLLLLVCFLDKAKESRIIEHDPCLFCMDAEFKSSKDLLLAFSRDFLSGEGILSRHLGFLGLPVSHVQTPLDEFSFAVKKLSVDLRCGIRLVRVMELFTQDWSLSRKLRVPAISRLQKIHNVDVALQVLKARGVDLNDEHGEFVENFTVSFSDGRVLCYLIHHYHPCYLPLSAVSKSTTQTVECGQRGTVGLNSSTSDSESSFDVWPESQNGTSTLMLFKELLEKERKNFQLVNTAVSSLGGVPAMIDPADMSNTIPNEKTLYRANKLCHLERTEYQRKRDACICLQAAVKGHLQRKRLDTWRMSATKIQSFFRMYKTRSLYLKMCSATVIIQKRFRVYRECVRCRHQFLEFKAATICLQAAYRGYSLRKMIKYQNKSATIIQTAVRAHIHRRRFVEMRQASAVIQRWFRAFKERQKIRETYLNMQRAALTLQAAYRGHRVRKQMLKHHRAATVFQAAFRMFVIRKDFLRLKQAAVSVQKRFRAKIAGQNQKRKYQNLRKSVVRLQALWRGQTVRKQMRKWHDAAVAIQSLYRTHVVQSMYRSKKRAALVLQRQYRAYYLGKKQHYQYVQIRKAVIAVQAGFRGMKARRELKEKHRAATTIQAAFKAYSCKKKLASFKKAATFIQQWYRACSVGRHQCQEFIKLKQVAVKLQAVYRGSKVRKDLRNMYQAATVIQANFRMYKARIVYRAMKLAATIIQQHYKACARRNRERKKYLLLKSSAVVIQSAYRGMKTRLQIQKMHRAATVIQATYRKHKQHIMFRRFCWAASVIQQRYKAHKIRNIEVKKYRAKKNAAVVIQSAFRGFKSRRQVMEMHKAATIIQRTFRTYCERRRFLSLKAASVVIQQKYRATVAAKTDRKVYLMHRCAIVALQSAYRGMKDRRTIRKMHQAATVIQAAFRMHRARIPFQAMKLAATLIQKYYRAYVNGKNERQAFIKLRNSAVLIQGAYRGMKERRQLQAKCKAAVVIQAKFRMHLHKSYYKRLQWAAQFVQQRYRANKIRETAMEMLKSKKHAAILIQSAFRGMKSRQCVKDMHKAASIIQSSFKAYRERKRYLSVKLSVLAVQQRYRATVAAKRQKEHYSSLRHATLTIQAAYRGFRTRKEIRQKHLAATVIQAAFRSHRETVKFQAMKMSSLIIQKHYKAYIQGRKDREKYLKLRLAVVTIQAMFRGKRVRQNVAEMQKAASTVQASYRMYRQRMAFKRMRWAASVLQQRFRAHRVRNSEMLRYQSIRKAVVCIQAAFRAQRARKLVKQVGAARKIQSVLKMFLRRRHFLKQKAASVVIQSVYRSYRARVSYTAMRVSAVVIQRWYRSCRVAQKQQAKYHAVKQGALTLQSAYRGMVARKFLKHKRAAVKVQSVLHMVMYRRRFLKLRSATVRLQASFRAYAAMKQFRRYRMATLTIQKHYKAHKAKKAQRSTYLKTLESIRKLQSRVRGYLEYRRFQRIKKSTVTIQIRVLTLNIGGISPNRYLKICQSVRIIQKRWRETLYARKEHHNFLKMKSSSIKIQATWKGYCTRKKLLREKRMKRAAITLQAFCRGWLVRKRIAEEKEVKRRLRFSAAVYHHLCAMKIQRRLRAYLALKSAKQQMHSVISLQRWIRSKLQRKRYLEEREKMIKVQRAVRAWLHRRNEAATVIQQAVKRFLFKRRQQRAQRGIIKFQALWRGFRSRKKSDTSEIVAMRCRFESVNQGVREEDKLWNKTTIAIDYLLKYKHFSYILAALKHLETATRLSSKCCEHLVNSGATLTIFTLIRSCNRSVPCMEVITYAVQVLLNLSKYDKTTDAVYDVDHSIDTLLDLLQIYRDKAGDKVADKGGSIFAKTCFLLVILLQNTQRAVEVRNLPKAVDRICSIYRLTARKHKMDAARTLTRQKMNVSLNGSFFSQVTPHKTKAIPRIAPDWVLRKDNMKEVVDPLQAIQMVADALAIVP
nr:PREDICTED: abnormal spindle-like microcephaly-associated protein [Lepisosteus oculatus]